MSPEQQQNALSEALNMAAVQRAKKRTEYRADRPISLAVSRYLDSAQASDLVRDIYEQLAAMGFCISSAEQRRIPEMNIILNCHTCARAMEIEADSSEVCAGFYAVPDGTVVTCGHCGKEHRRGYRLRVRDAAYFRGEV